MCDREFCARKVLKIMGKKQVAKAAAKVARGEVQQARLKRLQVVLACVCLRVGEKEREYVCVCVCVCLRCLQADAADPKHSTAMQTLLRCVSSHLLLDGSSHISRSPLF